MCLLNCVPATTRLTFCLSVEAQRNSSPIKNGLVRPLHHGHDVASAGALVAHRYDSRVLVCGQDWNDFLETGGMDVPPDVPQTTAEGEPADAAWGQDPEFRSALEGTGIDQARMMAVSAVGDCWGGGGRFWRRMLYPDCFRRSSPSVTQRAVIASRARDCFYCV